MMRGTHPRFAAGWSLAVVMLLAPPQSRAADWLPYWPWSWSAPADPKMAPIVAAVRAEEAKYRDFEYIARITVRDAQRQDRAAPSDLTTMARRHVIFQGGRTYFRHEAFERAGAMKYRHEETSAYDGERTRTVVADNCTNIHIGRWQHPLIFPAHSLPLAHYGVNFPLSIFLSGTDAIHATLGYPPGLVDSVPWQTFRKVETRLEGEEALDGVRCVKVRVNRWYQPNNPPLAQFLWLAPERNYHCVKEEHPYGAQRHEMRVHELREAAPGVWFPAKISVVVSQVNAANRANPPVLSRTEMTIDEVSLAPRHEAARFRDVAIPADLPVFTIQDRRLVDSMLPQPFVDDWAKKHLAELARRLGEQERRYGDIEVKARTLTTFPHSSGSARNVRYDQMTEERSIIRGGLAFFDLRLRTDLPGGWQDTMSQINAYDGEWTRSSWHRGERTKSQGNGATLRRGNAKTLTGRVAGFSAHRPHTLLLRQGWAFESLADLLAAGPESSPAQSPFEFRYCGTAEVDGHPCNEVRGDPSQFNRNLSVVLYLAIDRNEIPIKMESYANYYGKRLVPTGVSRCGDLREIAPGLWYPFRVTEFAFDAWALPGQGWILLNSRRDTTVESVTSAARVSDAVFRDVTVPAGTVMPLADESGLYIGQVQQPEDGVPWLSLKRYLELSSQAQFNAQLQRVRRAALDAHIGRPVPGFSRGAAWLGGKPPTPESLRGRVMVLGFWAEWDDTCRDDLVRLNQLHRDSGKDGPAIVGVHPPGSEPAEIERVIDALKLEFPICVDATDDPSAHPWGDLFGGLAVRSVPHAVVVDRAGKVVASGRLDDVLDRARALIRKGR